MTAPGPSTSRIDALDFAKGMLVVCMVIYHSLNYSTDYTLGFAYLAFLPPSFIIITGFLVARVYLQRPESETTRTSGRLLVRGGKLFLIFTLLNVGAALMSGGGGRPASVRVASFFKQWYDVYVEGHGREVAFEVLLPIAYFLLLAPLLLLSRHHRQSLVLSATALALVVAMLAERFFPHVNIVLLLAAGFVGAALGRVPDESLRILCRHRVILILAYGLHFAASRYIGQPFLMQQAGAVIALAVLYALGASATRSSWGHQRILVLGRYSLLAYIAQIAFLQVVIRICARPDPSSFEFALLFAGTMMFTSVAAEVTDFLRRRAAPVDSLYKTIFA